MSIYDNNLWMAENTYSSDGAGILKFCGARALSTGYGPVVYGVQFNSTQTAGRWGNYNIYQMLFYPDGSGWTPVS
ncbi:hypothetical protein [Frankia sp. EI5c]|uniref:hypothetical protein n=1 Tax=Frankia sp. EI5c TaxID=683316 RepID=UPI00082692AD|nr:hypothetical protein [Frankia sp. EI5c]